MNEFKELMQNLGVIARNRKNGEITSEQYSDVLKEFYENHFKEFEDVYEIGKTFYTAVKNGKEEDYKFDIQSKVEREGKEAYSSVFISKSFSFVHFTFKNEVLLLNWNFAKPSDLQSKGKELGDILVKGDMNHPWSLELLRDALKGLLDGLESTRKDFEKSLENHDSERPLKERIQDVQRKKAEDSKKEGEEILPSYIRLFKRIKNSDDLIRENFELAAKFKDVYGAVPLSLYQYGMENFRVSYMEKSERGIDVYYTQRGLNYHIDFFGKDGLFTFYFDFKDSPEEIAENYIDMLQRYSMSPKSFLKRTSKLARKLCEISTDVRKLLKESIEFSRISE